MPPIDLIATSTFGLETVVAREVRDLGYETTRVENARVHFQGDESAICCANLWLRSADRVLIRLGEFEARDFGQLFDRTNALPWERWLPANAAFPVNGRSVRSQLSSVPACQKIVKKAVVERLRQAHQTDTLDESGPAYSIEVAMLSDRATLTIDTTGAGLHKRGYRTRSGPAPLKETLAAAMVQLSFWKPDRPLIDPFCGTGTIPIEAAMIGRNIAPGLQRSFVSEDWPAIDANLWQVARDDAHDAIKPDLPARIIATDIDGKVLDLARDHARRAGVFDDIHFQQRDFADLRAKQDYGCMITNPPYGQRLGESEEVRELYRSFPDILRWMKTWSHFILTADKDFEKIVGQEADKRRKLYNGRIECTYYQFHGPRKPDVSTFDSGLATPDSERSSADSGRRPAAFGGLPSGTDRQLEDFANRLKKRARHLRKWPARGITCFRLYERDVPDIPLVVDQYDDCLHIAEYERPHEHTPAQHEEWLDAMEKTAAAALSVAPDRVFFKRRNRQRGLTQHEKTGDQHFIKIALEQGLKFELNLSDYVDTGLFLDHRNTREMVRRAAKGKRFLNLFAYTGAFTVYAAAGGAAATTTVDHSNTYLDWAKRNLKLNNLAGEQHRFVRADSMKFLEAHEGGEHYDLAVIDPPTYSNRKGYDNDWEVQRDYLTLFEKLLPLMTPEGMIYFSTNFRRFKMDEHAIAGLRAGVSIREISKQTVPEDFRNQRIHRCWLVRVESRESRV